jgi:hypothetical protein
VEGAIAAQMQQVSREKIPDMPDRIVAGTGRYHRVPVISRGWENQSGESENYLVVP